MGKDMSKASDHPTTDAQASIVIDGEDDVAYISLSSTDVKIESPPELNDTGRLIIAWKCTAKGTKVHGDGEVRPVRTLKVTSAWHPNGKPLDQDPNQGELFPDNTGDGQ